MGRATSRHPCVPRPPRRAFSLLELAIVLAILAVLSAVAMPRYARSLERYRADAAARRVVADLTYARQSALAASASRTVAFDAGTNTCTLQGIRDPDRDVTPYVVDLGRDPYRADVVSAVFDDPLDNAEDPAAVIFNGFGVPDSGGSIVINVGPHTRTVAVDADSGRAEIQ